MRKIDGVSVSTAASTEQIIGNILDARKRCLTPIYDCTDWREGMPIAIVGGGPSLLEQLDELRKFKYVMACGSVHDYLIEANIIPTWTVVCDPDPIMINYLRKIQYGCKYLIASQCAPELFDYFDVEKGRIFVWNAAGDNFDAANFGSRERTILTGGGCTVGTRAMALAMQFGYWEHHLFGFDTCVKSESEHHAYPFDNPEVETLGELIDIQIDNLDGPSFKVAGYMLGQYYDFKNILAQNAAKLRVFIHGDGLLAHHMELAKQKALEYQNGD